MDETLGGNFKGNKFAFNIKVLTGSIDFSGFADCKNATGKTMTDIEIKHNNK